MTKVKEMVTCMGTGKVCFRVRDAYNQLLKVTSSINALEADGQDGTIAYEIAHTAMSALKNDLSKQVHKTCLNCELDVARKAAKQAEKVVREARRASNEAYEISAMRVREGIEEEQLRQLTTREVYELYQSARLVDSDCIAAEQAIQDAYKVLYAANVVLRDKKEVFDRFYL
jgi:hypothetical protein